MLLTLSVCVIVWQCVIDIYIISSDVIVTIGVLWFDTVEIRVSWFDSSDVSVAVVCL